MHTFIRLRILLLFLFLIIFSKNSFSQTIKSFTADNAKFLVDIRAFKN